jgi:GT2 family glycosyltransferase
MDVSIIIVNYNTFQLTSDCIRSVIKYTRDVSYEIILVDNASTECDANDFQKNFPEIKLIANTHNLGFAKGNNEGIEKAEGECILLLNSDTLLIEDSISKCFYYFKKNQKCGALSVKLIFPDGKVQTQASRFPSATLDLLELFRANKWLPTKISSKIFLGRFWNYDEPVRADYVWGTFFFFPKKILTPLPENKLPETFHFYTEDVEWCYVIRQQGYYIQYLPDTSVIHLMGQSGKQLYPNTKKQKILAENLKTFILKYKGKRYWILYKFIHTLLLQSQMKNRELYKEEIINFKNL